MYVHAPQYVWQSDLAAKGPYLLSRFRALHPQQKETIKILTQAFNLNTWQRQINL